MLKRCRDHEQKSLWLEKSCPPVGYKYKYGCAAGSHTGTQYNENQTPTKDKCREICHGLGRPGFAYGNVKGDKINNIVSDGGRGQ
eukprot:TRINITY_DN3647_c0_g1_i1.p2 TRINITY_DN3647_c0_g1~~TRINITY_DN3647_c0_g1_i1.p2  ORF type:complete len:85 (-),score=10.80 TRINITY_DN3647_c0_g1_i1:227-481(-)